MKIEGDTVSPAVPGLQGAYAGFVLADCNPAKRLTRVFAGHFNGLSSIRWDGGKWVDEGRLPNFANGINGLAEDSDGILWAAYHGPQGSARRSCLHRHARFQRKSFSPSQMA